MLQIQQKNKGICFRYRLYLKQIPALNCHFSFWRLFCCVLSAIGSPAPGAEPKSTGGTAPSRSGPRRLGVVYSWKPPRSTRYPLNSSPLIHVPHTLPYCLAQESGRGEAEQVRQQGSAEYGKAWQGMSRETDRESWIDGGRKSTLIVLFQITSESRQLNRSKPNMLCGGTAIISRVKGAKSTQ